METAIIFVFAAQRRTGRIFRSRKINKSTVLEYTRMNRWWFYKATDISPSLPKFFLLIKLGCLTKEIALKEINTRKE